LFDHFPSFFTNCTTGSKNDKKMKKTRGKLHFFIFRKIFAPLEANMMKKYKKMKKMKKNMEKMKKMKKK